MLLKRTFYYRSALFLSILLSINSSFANFNRDSIEDPTIGTIHILKALWQSVDSPANCNATPQVTEYCEGQVSCDFPATNASLCGDPAVDHVKVLYTTFSCAEKTYESTTPEGSTAHLTCRSPLLYGAKKIQ